MEQKSQYDSAKQALAAAQLDETDGSSFRLRHTFALRRLRRRTEMEQVTRWLGIEPEAMANYRRGVAGLEESCEAMSLFNDVLAEHSAKSQLPRPDAAEIRQAAPGAQAIELAGALLRKLRMKHFVLVSPRLGWVGLGRRAQPGKLVAVWFDSLGAASAATHRELGLFFLPAIIGNPVHRARAASF